MIIRSPRFKNSVSLLPGIDEPVDPTAIKAIEMEYTTDITPDYLTYYDITVTHGADSNDGVTSDIYTDGWVYSQSRELVAWDTDAVFVRKG